MSKLARPLSARSFVRALLFGTGSTGDSAPVARLHLYFFCFDARRKCLRCDTLFVLSLLIHLECCMSS
jgi:hypothetical protein